MLYNMLRNNVNTRMVIWQSKRVLGKHAYILWRRYATILIDKSLSFS
jgi:hypothetical protein